MIRTHDLLAALQEADLVVAVHGSLPETVTGVADDSREVAAGGAFVAVRGSLSDGHRFLAQAAAKGMALAIVEESSDLSTPYIRVRASRLAAAIVGAAAYGFPARQLTIVGVTGTSGKTTTVSMLRHLLDRPHAPAASIGTLGVLVGRAGVPLDGGHGLTTPGPIELQRVLAALRARGVASVAMEVSSHALDQGRALGIAFHAGVFTNLSRDHLDYHETMERYFEAKAKLVSALGPGGVAVVNGDVPEWGQLPPAPRRVTYGTVEGKGAADVTAREIAFTPEGSEWTLVAGDESARAHLPLMGDFNVSNALAAAAATWALGTPIAEIARAFASLPQVPGRLERICDAPVVLRDYAHKPDALERALSALRPFVRKRLILVFGCGGDRDRGKRPLMGAIAERLADAIIVTSDNPRTEDPEGIIRDIISGMTSGRFVKIEDRREAIARALRDAQDGDVVLLAGKGHETYQIRGTESFPFDEREIVQELLSPGTSR